MLNKIPGKIKILILGLISLGIFAAALLIIYLAPRRAMPILMYHYVVDIDQDYDSMTLNKQAFENQMEYLLKHNYKVVSLKKAVEMMKKGKTIPRDWIALTFDDGGEDFYINVYPLIKKFQFDATLFVYIDKLTKERGGLSWGQMDKLRQDSLMAIGSHAITHDPLVLLTSSQAKKEIYESKLILERRLGAEVNFFSYPFGALNESIRQMVIENGYAAAVGTAYRKGEFGDNDIYALRRVFVSQASYFPFMFRFMVSGYYVPARELLLKILNIKAPRDVYK